MVRKVIIEAILVPESASKNPKEIEKEILREIQHGSIIIPWCNRIEKVKIVDER